MIDPDDPRYNDPTSLSGEHGVNKQTEAEKKIKQKQKQIDKKLKGIEDREQRIEDVRDEMGGDNYENLGLAAYELKMKGQIQDLEDEIEKLEDEIEKLGGTPTKRERKFKKEREREKREKERREKRWNPKPRRSPSLLDFILPGRKPQKLDPHDTGLGEASHPETPVIQVSVSTGGGNSGLASLAIMALLVIAVIVSSAVVETESAEPIESSSSDSDVSINVRDSSNGEELDSQSIVVEVRDNNGRLIGDEELSSLPPGDYNVEVSVKILNNQLEMATQDFTVEEGQEAQVTIFVSTIVPVKDITTIVDSTTAFIFASLAYTMAGAALAARGSQRPKATAAMVGVATFGGTYYGLTGGSIYDIAMMLG